MTAALAMKPFTIRLDVSAETIYNAFVGACEHNNMTRAWAHEANYEGTTPPLDENGNPDNLYWWGHKNIYDEGFKMEIKFDDPSKPEGNAKGRRIVTHADIITGLTLMATKSPDHFADLISEDGSDAITCDVFLQYVVLNELVYG